MKPTLSQLGRRQRPSDISRLMSTALERPDMLSLAAGFTDNASLPLQEVQSIVGAFGEFDAGRSKNVLQYGSTRGRDRLREILAERIQKMDANSALGWDASQLMVTNGSQQQLYLAMQTLCDPGDIVLVERPTYFVFLEMLDGLGIEARSMPMTDSGDVDIDGLRETIFEMKRKGDFERLKAVYLVSYYANPSGHSVSDGAKRGIASVLAEEAGAVALIEDAAYRELHFEESHSAPGILALEEGRDLPMLYTSTLTKPFATGLKVGYGVCTDDDWRDAMQSVKGQQDFGTSNFAQAILERALEGGAYDALLERLRQLYHSKMVRLDAALDSPLRSLGWCWKRPRGGLYLWLTSPNEMATDFDSAFHAACVDEAVMYVPGDLCHAGRTPQNCVRLSYGVLEEAMLDEAASRFVSAAERLAAADRG